MPTFPNLYNLSRVLHQPDLYKKLEQEEFDHLKGFNKIEVGLSKLFHKKDDFDSSVFGVNVGKAEYLIGVNRHEIAKILKQFFTKNPYEYVVFRCAQTSTHWIQALEKHGAVFLDSTVDLIQEVKHVTVKKPSLKLEKPDLEDIPQLQGIAGSFQFGRFFSDPEFQYGKAIHERWIENCVRGKAADQVFVYRTGTTINSFIAIKTEYLAGLKTMRIVLLGKDSAEKGLAIKMLQFLQHKAKQEDYDLMSISTQGANIPALRSYIQSGFLPYSTGVTMRWKR